MSDLGAGNGAVPVGIVPASPAPFSFVAQQMRLEDGRLYTVLTFYSAFGAYLVFLDGDAGESFLNGLKPIVGATKAGIALPPKGAPHG